MRYNGEKATRRRLWTSISKVNDASVTTTSAIEGGIFMKYRIIKIIYLALTVLAIGHLNPQSAIASECTGWLPYLRDEVDQNAQKTAIKKIIFMALSDDSSGFFTNSAVQ
jgi:hypothetical protein